LKNNRPDQPLTGIKQLAEILREQGIAEDQIQDLSRELLILKEWQAPVPTAEMTHELVHRLEPYLPTLPPVRQSIKDRSSGLAAELVRLIRLVGSQISLFQPSFWLASAVIVFIGALLILFGPGLNPTFLLQVIGPLLSYLGTASAFRGNGLRMLEFELACPPTPRQLTLARLTIILGYDITLGLLLSGVMGAFTGSSLSLLTLHWLAPLLLGTGLTLLLSLRMPANRAAAISYTGWLAVLVFAVIAQNGVQTAISVFPQLSEWLFGLAGLIMIVFGVIYFPKAITNLLPRQ
jgi:hypothetical protein